MPEVTEARRFENMVYRDAQKVCGLTVGDYVLITGKSHWSDRGWLCEWNAGDMDKTVGRVGKIIRIEPDFVRVQLDYGPSYSYPFFVLHKITEDLYMKLSRSTAEVFADMYMDAQQNCPLRAGDVVKVKGTAQYGMGGWRTLWTKCMDDTVGKTGTVRLIDFESGGVLVTFDEHSTGFYYPYFVLEKETTKEDAPYQGPFKSFSPVLVRNSIADVWELAIYKSMGKNVHYTMDDRSWQRCVYYRDYPKLLGTKDNPAREE